MITQRIITVNILANCNTFSKTCQYSYAVQYSFCKLYFENDFSNSKSKEIATVYILGQYTF